MAAASLAAATIALNAARPALALEQTYSTASGAGSVGRDRPIKHGSGNVGEGEAAVARRAVARRAVARRDPETPRLRRRSMPAARPTRGFRWTPASAPLRQEP